MNSTELLPNASDMHLTPVPSPAPPPTPPSGPAGNAGIELAGYQLEERIGIGGFGEVWRATVPGGFSKAVKILFGAPSGAQAETELKSLQRMRDLRHPFLLSVERVEVIDGRVIIVTELADRSLDRRFREAVSSGLRGIPRDELLGYLRDAADALDFMSEQHGLQHLDIKPENLMLQGAHAKVGDFGLTKNLGMTANVSLVNGFTPLYAPPELFDGRADRTSDQYSLAIVYQLMLTGSPPFNGRSAAQLTSQHLKSAPDLSVLHPSDRAVVARALSKNPRTRFASCRQFIDELSRRRIAPGTSPVHARAGESADYSRIASLTELVDTTSVGKSDSAVLPPAVALPPVQVAERTAIIRPTLFVGIGGLGCLAVEQLQEQLHSQFPEAGLPAIQFLCIDSDIEALNAVKRRSSQAAEARRMVYSSIQTFAIPLKTSHEYRKIASEHLTWLSRRWLFNIPRSGRVEGLRPLGRLTFVGHQQQIRDTIRRGIQAALRPDAISRTEKESAIPVCNGTLDVVLVGSTSGGTASGALIDLAWTARSVIAEGRFPNASVSAFLIHGTSGGRQLADLQDANTLCFLRELQHFCLPGMERPLIAPGVAATEPARPFDAAWLLHLGENLSSAEFQQSLEPLSQYLQLRTLSPARRAMDAWQQEAQNGSGDQHELLLRTFGLTRVDARTWTTARSDARQLLRTLIERWLQDAEDNLQPEVQSLLTTELAEYIQRLSLSSEGAIDLVPKLLRGDRSRRIEEYCSDLFARISGGQSATPLPEQISGLIAADMQVTPQPKNSIASVSEEIRYDLSSSLSRCLTRIEQTVKSVLDGHGRLAAARFLVSQLIRSTEQAITAGAGHAAELEQAFSELCDQCTANSDALRASPENLLTCCRQFGILVACQTISRHISLHMKSVRDSLEKIQTDRLQPVQTRLTALVAELRDESRVESEMPDQLKTAFDDFLISTVRYRLSALQYQDVRATDLSSLSTDAANFLMQTTASDPDTAPKTETSGAPPEFPASARPLLRNVGGGQRVMAVTPEEMPPDVWSAQLTSEFGPCVHITSMPRNDICVFCETEGISISAVNSSLSHLKPAVVDLSARVHSRHDIPW